MNKMQEIKVEKLTLNMGSGKDQSMLDKGIKLLSALSGAKPVKTITHKRIPEWGVRPGLPVGCKVKIRGKKAVELIRRILGAKDNILSENNFDERGTVSIGIHEYIDITDAKYDADIGIIGLQACITLERPGFRIKRRKNLISKPGKRHQITQEDAMEFMKKTFNIKIGDEE